MDTIDIKYFGRIDNPPQEELYQASTFFQEAEVELDLNFFEHDIDPDWSEELVEYLNQLSHFKKRIEKAIASDYRDGGAVKEYIDYHIEDDPLILVDLFDDTSLESDKEQLINALKLEHIGFYPGEKNYAVWDFMIGREYTDMLIVVYTDNKGRIESVSWES